MRDLWDLLDYTAIIENIKQLLDAPKTQRNPLSIIVVRGPVAVGKTTLITQIGQQREEAGDKVVVAVGDKHKATANFHPLDSGFHDSLDAWALTSAIIAFSTPVVEASPVSTSETAPAILAGVLGALSHVTKKSSKRKRIYDKDEQAILARLTKYAKRQRLLLIADNLHKWDKKSLGFLQHLCSLELQTTHKELRNLYVLAAENPPEEQPATAPVEHANLLAPIRTKIFDLPIVPQSKFRDVLIGLGAPVNISAQESDELYTFFGGHLDLARHCAVELSASGTLDFLHQDEQEDRISRLLDQRIHNFGIQRQKAAEILQIAAVLGQSFRRQEIECATSIEGEQLRRVLRNCQQRSLIGLSDQKGHFVHERIREHFLKSQGFDRVTVHERLIDCFRQIRPADYEERCDNARHAEARGETHRLAAHAALARRRDGRTWNDAPQSVIQALEESPLQIFVDKLNDAFDPREYISASHRLDILNSAPRPGFESLDAEADFVRVSILRITKNRTDRLRAIEILRKWDGYEDAELEIGIRLMLQLLSCLVLDVDKQEAERLDGRIRRVLHQQSDLNIWASDIPYVLDRLSSRLYPPETALPEVRRAVDFFGPSSGEGVVRRPDDYYRSLVNYVSELIIVAQYAEAVEASETLTDLVTQHEPGSFDNTEYVFHNRTLAEYRDGRITAKVASERQSAIVKELSDGADGFYVKNGLAAYLALTGDYSTALGIYDDLIDRLNSRDQPEPSMQYDLEANRVAVNFVAGNRVDCVQTWQRLREVVERIPYPCANFMQRRHDLLGDVLQAGGDFDAVEFDVCLTALENRRLGPSWDQLGRGFRMPAIEWYS